MLVYRKARQEDAQQIAALHAISWQQNYRGVFSDYYLDEEVLPNRIRVWQDRLNNPSKNQLVLLAEEKGEVVGFVCAYLDQDATYGTYLDNLHVSSKMQGSGIGTQLMGKLAEALKNSSKQGIYLWVIEGNDLAINFYDTLQGKALDKVAADDIGDALFLKIRYVWSSLPKLQNAVAIKLKAYERRRI